MAIAPQLRASLNQWFKTRVLEPLEHRSTKRNGERVGVALTPNSAAQATYALAQRRVPAKQALFQDGFDTRQNPFVASGSFKPLVALSVPQKQFAAYVDHFHQPKRDPVDLSGGVPKAKVEPVQLSITHGQGGFTASLDHMSQFGRYA
jgi:hypothetical protein